MFHRIIVAELVRLKQDKERRKPDKQKRYPEVACKRYEMMVRGQVVSHEREKISILHLD